MNKIIFLVLFFIFNTHQKGLTKKELNQKMIQFNMSPVVSLLLIYDTLAPRADVLEMLMESIVQKRKGYFNVLMVDCNTDDQQVLTEFVYCQDQYRKHLPALVFSEPTLNHDTKQQTNLLSGVKQYQGPLDDKSLFNFAVPLMRTYSVQLKTRKDLKKFEQSYPQIPKVIFFTDKQKISPLFRALTAHFRNTIVFGHVFSTSILAKDLNVTKYPVFLINGKDKIEVKSNLTEIIQRFEIIKGEPTKIFIKEYQSSNNVQLDQNNIEQLVFKTPEHILIHVIGEDGKDHPQWSNFTMKFHKMFKFYQTQSLKQALGVKSTPAIVYFPKSIAKKAVQKSVFSSRHTFDDIYNEINSIIQDHTVPLSNYLQLQKMTSINFQEGKFVVIYFHSKEIPMSYKAVSNQKQFQEDLAFFRMKDPERQVLEQYQLKKLPSLIIMMVDDEPDTEKTQKKGQKQDEKSVKLRIATYQGKYTYHDLYNFFNSISRKSIESKINQDRTDDVESNSKKIQQIKKQNKLKSKCSQACFLLLINGNPENSEKNKNYIAALEKQSGRMYGSNFGYIDAACHSQFSGTFQILEDELPALIYVDPKFQKFSRMIGRLEPSSISGFFSKIKSRKAQFRGYDRLKFDNKNCADQHEKLKKISENASAISEQQAEILAQLKAQQQKKRQQFSKAQKDDKIRKKNKKKKPKKQEQNEEL